MGRISLRMRSIHSLSMTGIISRNNFGCNRTYDGLLKSNRKPPGRGRPEGLSTYTRGLSFPETNGIATLASSHLASQYTTDWEAWQVSRPTTVTLVYLALLAYRSMVTANREPTARAGQAQWQLSGKITFHFLYRSSNQHDLDHTTERAGMQYARLPITLRLYRDRIWLLTCKLLASAR